MGYRGDQLRGLYLPKYFLRDYAQEGLLLAQRQIGYLYIGISVTVDQQLPHRVDYSADVRYPTLGDIFVRSMNPLLMPGSSEFSVD
jgi:hypothetical protein